MDLVLRLDLVHAQVLLLGPEHAPFEKVIRYVERDRALLGASFVVVLVFSGPDGAQVVEGEADVAHVFV